MVGIMIRTLSAALLGMALFLPQLAQASEPVDVWRVMRDAYNAGKDDGKGLGEQRLKQQLERVAQSSIGVKMNWSHENLHFADNATIRVDITNNLDVPIELVPESLQLRVPCELFGDDTSNCVPLPSTTRLESTKIPPTGHINMEWQLQPRIAFPFIHSAFFRTGNGYEVTLSFAIRLPRKMVDVSTVFDPVAIPIAVSKPLSIDLGSWILAGWAVVGSLVGGLVHAAARVGFIRRLKNKDDSPFEPHRALRKESQYMSTFIFVGAVMAALLGASVGISAEAKKLISARILDAPGAILFGFVVHFMTYDLGYSKLMPLWRNLMRD